jgi:hypothetical protein
VGSDEPVWRGYFYTGLICSVTFINSIFAGQMLIQQYIVALRVRTALTAAVYKKSIKLSNIGRKEMTSEIGHFYFSLCPDLKNRTWGVPQTPPHIFSPHPTSFL